MSSSRRFARARLGVLALTAVLVLVLGIVPALVRPAAAADLRGWLSRALRTLTRRDAERIAAPGDTVVVFGPKQAATPTGAQATTVEQFAVPAADPGRRYLLRVQNGADDGSARVSTGSVQLNGATIFTGAELGAMAAGASVYKPIGVQGSGNTIAATVQGAAGSYLTLSVVAAPDPTFTVWGSKTYERTNGTPVTVTEHFTLPAGAGAPYFLHVINGDGARRSSSATVKLNGVPVVGTSDLNQTIAGFVKAVALQHDNVLEVQLQGGPGSRLTLRVAATDAAAPVLSITAPAAGLVTREQQLAVVGTVTDQTPTRVTANGVEATLQGNSADASGFSATVPLTAEGTNTITVRATDAAGHTTDSVRTVIRDTEAPVVTVTSLPDTATVSADSFAVVSGTVHDATKVTANLNGAPVAIDSASGAFSKRVALQPGVNFLTLVATDVAGNATTVVRQVTRDATPPTLTVTAPSDSQVTRASTIHVVGAATASTAPTVTVNGAPVTLSATGAFAADVALAEGTTTITVSATTAAGTHAVVTRTVIRDTQVPTVTLAGPADGLVTKDATIALSGTATDATRLTLTLNGAPLAVAANGAFSATLPLDEGPATFTLVATDAAGNATTTTRNVVRDATAPVLTIQAPLPGAYSRTAAYQVIGSVIDATTVQLTVNGTAAAIAPDGGFVANLVLVDGPNPVTVVATDAAGNVSEATGSVMLDAAPPALTVSTPATDDVVTRTSAFVVTGIAADRTGASVTVNGIPATIDGAGAFSAEITLAEGLNSVTVMATDGAGNTATALRQVRLDTQAPVLSVDAPADGLSTGQSAVTVSGSVSDASAVTVTVNGAVVAVSGNTFTTGVTLLEGSNTIGVVATDAAGNTATVTRTVTLVSAQVPQGFTERLPIDLTVHATAPANGVVSNVGNATQFLYRGPNAVQHDVAEGAIAAARAAVIRGRLFSRDSQPLSGVTVRIAGHSELGWTASRPNGLYDLAVAGGAKLTVTYSKDGYFPVTRDVLTTWNEFTPVEDVVLTAADTVATPISFTAPIEVARGSVVQDASGQRQATLMFRQGTQASMVLPNGTTRLLPSITVRATEYTAGGRGPEAMPATLPVTTGYTYALEYSADEAISAGATEVRFSKPVSSYTENFLAFPVGTLVPSGYYDRGTSEWKPSNNGRVIRVLTTTAGSVTVDVTGSGVASSADTLAKLGIDADELAQLGQLYQPGQTLWRVPLTHFTPGDYNWGWAGPRYAKKPKPDPKRDPKKPLKIGPDPDYDDLKCGSEISVQSQILGETFSLANTPFYLHYSTDRTPGFAADRTIDVPLSDDSLPQGIQKIRLDIQIAGRQIRREFAPAPKLSYRYTWDGIDAYGRRLNGPQPITAKVSYYYYGIYLPPMPYEQMFGAFPALAAAADSVVPSRQLVYMATEYKDFVGTWDARAEGLGGWTLSEHHVYDPITKVLYKGDGTKLAAAPIGDVIKTAIGTGVWGHTGDGGPASAAQIGQPGGMVGMPDGSLIWSDEGILRRVDSAGTISTLPNGNVGAIGPVLGPDGSLYYGGPNELEYRRKPDGTVSVVAGGGGSGFYDGVGAFEVRNFGIQYTGRAVGPDGALHILRDNVVWRLNKDNRFYRVAGTWVTNCDAAPAEGPALAVSFCHNPGGFAVGPDNSIYVAEFYAGWIRKISPDGMATIIVGGAGSSPSFNNGPAIKAQVKAVNTLSVSPDGSLLIVDNDGGLVRQVSPDGNIRIVAGVGNPAGYPTEGALATTQALNYSRNAATMRDGSLYLGNFEKLIRRVAPALPGMKLGEFFIPSEDGSELYVFGVDGRHVRTRDAQTLNDIYRFRYDSAGHLASITDAVGLVTTIAPGGNGSSVAITSGRGVKSVVQLDANGFVSRLQGPQGYVVTPTHDDDGLLRTLRDERGLPHQFSYDSLGKLTADADTLGAQSLLAYVTGTKSTVTHTNAAGEATTYTVELAPNQTVTQTTLRSGQRPDSSIFARDGTRELRLPGSTRASSVLAADPRLGWPVSYARSSNYQTGASIRSTITHSRTKIGGSPDPIAGGGLLLDSTTVNGRLYLDSLDLTGRRASTSPQRRRTVTQFDGRGLITTRQRWSRPTSSFSYDSLGQLTSMTEGGLIDSVQWSALGFPLRTRRPDGSVVTYGRDTLGRVLSISFADTLTETFAYDASGNLTVANFLGGRRYGFGYDARGNVIVDSLVSSGLLLGSYEYDGAGHLRTVRRPGRLALSLDYDPSGRLKSVGSSRVSASLTYDPVTNKPLSLVGGGQSYGMQYDGLTLTKIGASGLVSGSVEYAFNNDGLVRQVRVSGRSAVDYAFDGDGLVTRAGALALSREAVTGDVMGDTIGVVGVSRAYDDHGWLRHYELRIAGQAKVARALERDSIGRVVVQRDSSATGVSTTAYHYDVLDRLDQVTRDGVVLQQLEYDAAGNRLTVTTPSGVVRATYADDDRILNVGGDAIAHDSAGARLAERRGSDSLTYSHDDLGRLTSVTSTSSGVTSFSLDAAGRRIQEMKNGTVSRKFLYGAWMMPVAELDAAGVVKAEYVYGSGSVAPDYLVRDGKTIYLLKDQVGSVQLAIDATSGAVLQELEYDAAGVVSRNTNPGLQPFTFAGGLVDVDGRFVHFAARDYDPRTGRWLQVDPIGAAGGANRYVYSVNDPVNYSDPSGEDPERSFRCVVNIINLLACLQGPTNVPPKDEIGPRSKPMLPSDFADFQTEQWDADREQLKLKPRDNPFSSLPEHPPERPTPPALPPAPNGLRELLNEFRSLPEFIRFPIIIFDKRMLDECKNGRLFGPKIPDA